MDTAVQQQLSTFEAELLSVDGGKDPLATWHNYVSWARSALEAGDVQGLLERCVRRFRSDPRYLEDPRFIRLCVTYADSIGDYQAAEQVLRMCRKAGVGSTSALLYEAHAIVLEKLRSFAEAETVYSDGVRRSAQPLHRLEQRWSEFKARMSRRVDRQRRRDANSGARKPLKVVGKAHEPGSENFPPARNAGDRNEKPKPKGSPRVAMQPVKKVTSLPLATPKLPPEESEKPISRRLAFGVEDGSDMTINTKLALQDVDAMFNSPLPFEKEDSDDTGSDFGTGRERAGTHQNYDPPNVAAPPSGDPKRAKFSIFSDPGSAPESAPVSAPVAKPRTVINPYSAEVRSRIEESLAEWFAEQMDYYVIDIAPEIRVGESTILGEELRSDALSLRIDSHQSVSQGELYRVHVNREKFMTMKVQTPADPWELYMLRWLSKQAPSLPIPRAEALYDAESKSYLLCDPFPQTSLADLEKAGKLSSVLLLFIVGEVLSFLEAVHSKNIIHSGLSMPNIFLRGSNIHQAGVLITDFSVAVDTSMYENDSLFQTSSEAPWCFNKDTMDLAAMLESCTSTETCRALKDTLPRLRRIGYSDTLTELAAIRSDLQLVFTSEELDVALMRIAQ